MQNQYSLVYREEEREMMPLCRAEDIAVIPWSPLAKGYLSRPHEEYHSTQRGQTDSLIDERQYEEKGGREINRRVQKLAEEKGATMAQIALAWHLHKEVVTSVILGPTKERHLDQAVEALEIELSEEEMQHLEEPYEPVRVKGHS